MLLSSSSACLLTLLALFAVALPTTTAIFPFLLQTDQAPWPARAQPSWQTTTRSITTGTGVVYRPGSLILYGGVGSNDSHTTVWITRSGTQVGRTWDLLGGIVRNPFAYSNATRDYEIIAFAPNGYDEKSFLPRNEPASCEDPTGDQAYIISGVSRADVWLDDVWRTDDGREWVSAGRTEVPPRSRSSCVVLHDQSIVVTAGLDRPYPSRNGFTQEALNDVWRSTSLGTDWKLVTAAAAFPARSKTLMFAAPTPLRSDHDVIFVMGGKSQQEGNVFYNDVWASSDFGATWAQLTAQAPWEPRWGHSGVVTKDGVMVFFGGTVRDDYFDAYNGYNYEYYGDVWASFDGGYTWAECSGGRNVYNRTEAAVSLDVQGYFMMAAGYSLQTPRSDQRARPVVLWNRDVVRSSFSLERGEDDTDDGGRTLARMCGVEYPASGAGLRMWPTQKWNANGGAVAGIVLMLIFVTILFFGYLYTRNSVARHGQFQWPSATEVKQKMLTATALPDVSFLTNLPLAEQFRQTGEGQTNTNNLGEGLLGERETAEGEARSAE